MVKRTQTIRQQITNKLFEFVGPFREIGTERVYQDSTYKIIQYKSEY